jgi:adenylate kinase
MRAIITGQVGVDKKRYLDAVAALAAEGGEPAMTFHVGDMMYSEAPDVRPGRILDLPLFRLHTLRRSVFKDILAHSASTRHAMVNTHATFRWRHGLFRAFDFDQIDAFKPDLFICLVDNIEAVYHRLHRDHAVDATLKDLMVWREEEILATELLAVAVGCAHRFYVLSRGRHVPTVETCRRLITRPDLHRVYPSFPMTHIEDQPAVKAEVQAFRDALAAHFITFDPGEVDEKLLLERAMAAAKEGRDFIEAQILDSHDQPITIPVSVKQVLDIAGDVDGQIYARDFKLIDQSEMIISYIPELPGGIPALSSGVERELQHAFEGGKEVFVVWKPRRNPSPFITETATRVFRSTEEALSHFQEQGMFKPHSLFGH